MVATDHAPRVALLARAGTACERIDAALRDAGADVVLVADPLQSDPAQVRAAVPEAILVALDPAIEDAIDLYQDVLADPAYLVIFEEAEQAALRTGWDAARWLRHLTAKLHRHGNVLPAGAGVEEELHPVPGPFPSRNAAVDFEEAIVAFTGEAQELAAEVPHDSGLEGLSGAEEIAAGGQVLSLEDDGLQIGTLEELRLELEDEGERLDEGSLQVAGFAAGAEQVPSEGVELSLADFILEAEAGGRLELDIETGDDDAEVIEAGGLSFEPIAFSTGDDDAGIEELSYDPERFNRLGQAPAGIEEFLASQIQLAPVEEGGEASASTVAATPAAVAPSFDLSGLSLAGDDDVAPLAPARLDKPVFDLDALGSGLSLADPDSYGHGPLRGAVLIEAGLGGPDAVRQLLAALPDSLPRPILIHLPLEGGRYDRLVKQMMRATSAPVSVAADGQVAEAGSIYFVPPELGLKAAGSSWTFDASEAFDARALPADDSAVVILSGADAGCVPKLLAGGGWTGLLLGQTPDEGCYDPVGAQAAIAAGADHGSPAELAEKLVRRWSDPISTPNIDSSGMLQP